MSDIKVGDTVMLKSGGVAMTVQSIEDGVAWCVWQNAAKHVEQQYELVVLKKYEVSY